ncbi:hypothetical protein HDU81_001491 [Chytriomyces hyalinus]|nr:hypothetical protein HDU81_001491 [Chytriomyces hyalinus]
MDTKPREYQRFILEIAKSRNTIVVLPTGTGKTLIALLLIKHRQTGERSKKVSVFLAPHVPLAIQQTNYLRANCDFERNAFVSLNNISFKQWSEKTWKKEIAASGCMVMTPAICESVLRRGYLSMSQINVLVFDECHNARKSSQYNQIIALHYLPCLDHERPLIFGMTASPMSSANGKDHIQMAIRQLETNLCAKAITPDSHSDLKFYTLNPDKTLISYKLNSADINVPLGGTLMAQLIQLGIREIPQLRGLCNDAASIAEDFGSWVADVFVRDAMFNLHYDHFERVGGKIKRKKEKVDKRIQEKLDSSGMVFAVGEVDDLKKDENAEALSSKPEPVLSELQTQPSIGSERFHDIYGMLYGDSQMHLETEFSVDEQEKMEEAKLKEYIKLAIDFLNEVWRRDLSAEEVIVIDDEPAANGGSSMALTDDPSPDINAGIPTSEMKSFSFTDKRLLIPPSLFAKMSPKFLALVGILEVYATDDSFCGICFAEKRCSAMLLASLLPRCSTLKSFLRAEALIGHGNDRASQTSAIGFSMGISQQKRTVEQFRDRKLNLLVATKVAEEGIDIQPCNLVVRFDVVQTVISNIQSRGRARHKNSKYVVMVSENDYGTLQRMHELEKSEAEMNALLLERMNAGEDDIDPVTTLSGLTVSHDIKLTPDTIYETPTGSKMTTFNSVQAIFHYCTMLPHDSFSRLRPIFTTGPTLAYSPETGDFKTAWISSLQLPLNAPTNCRFISGKPCASAGDARRMVALEAVKMLHRAGVFNDRLKLALYDAGPVSDEADYIKAAQEAFGIKKLGEGPVGTYTVYVPECFGVTFPFDPQTMIPKKAGVSVNGGAEAVEVDAMDTDDDEVDEETRKKLAAIEEKWSKSVKRSDAAVVVTGYLVLLEMENTPVLDIALLLPFQLPEKIAQGNHKVLIDLKERNFKFHTCKIGVPMDSKRADLLQKFSNTLFYNALLRTSPPALDQENEYLLPVVPLISGQDAFLNLSNPDGMEKFIDWKSLDACAASPFSFVEPQMKKKKKSGSIKAPVKDTRKYDYVELFRTHGSDLVVVDRMYYNRRYRLDSLLMDRTPWNHRYQKMILAEFYKRRLYCRERILEDQPVLAGEFIRHMYQAGQAEVRPANEVHVNLIPQFCTPFPIKASLLSGSAIFLPIIIEYLYHCLCTLEIQSKLSMLDIVSTDLFQTAFISTNSQLIGSNYERLEFLGDSYLKMHLTLHLFVNNPSRDEGWLTRSRTALERNSNLMSASLAYRFPSSLLVNPLSRRTWAPPMRFPLSVRVSDKNTADIVEAVMGACIVASGIEGGGTALKQFFGHTYSVHMREYAPIMPYSMEASMALMNEMESEVVQSHNGLVVSLHQKIGYKFKNPLLAVEALTHTSALGIYDGLTTCFQRLEFLGDSILGFVVANELYKSPEHFDPGNLSALKDELVNNQYLSVISYKNGLHTLIKQASSPLAQEISNFGTRLAEAQKNAKTGEFYWHSLPHAPKTVSDVLEAMIGAVFVDSGCDFEVAKNFVDRLIVQDFWDSFMTTGASIKGVANPTREMALYAENCGCDAFYVRMTQTPGEEENICTIEKHGVVLATASASSKKLARRLAAVNVIPKLREMSQGGGDPLCNCAEKRKRGANPQFENVFSKQDLASDPQLVDAMKVIKAKIAAQMDAMDLESDREDEDTRSVGVAEPDDDDDDLKATPTAMTQHQQEEQEALLGPHPHARVAPNRRKTAQSVGFILLGGAALAWLLMPALIHSVHPTPPQAPPPEAWTPFPPIATSHPLYAATKRAEEAVKKLTRAQKEDMVMGTGWRGGPCTGHILPQPHIDFHGLCLQDSPMGVRFAANVTAFPSGTNVAATFDRKLMLEYGTAMGYEFRHVGAHIQLGPMMNLFRAPAAGRNWEGPGADPFLAAVSASTIMRGIQSQGVISTAKHFVANEQEHFRGESSSNVDMKTLMEVYVQPFEACVRAGVAAIMCSYNRLNQEYTCANDFLINKVLKGPDIDFRGFVLTDWDAQYSLMASDMVMAGHDRKMVSVANITRARAVDNRQPSDIPEARLDDSITRILAMYYNLGQDKNFPPYAFDSWEEKEKNVYNFDYRFKQHIPVARRVAAASTVLVKHTGGVLPLVDAKGLKLAVIGEDARLPKILNEFENRGGNDGTLAQGWGSGTAEFPYLVAPLEGITARASEATIVSSVDNYDLEAAKKAAASADFAIVFANADSGEGGMRVEGHDADRNDLKLWHESNALIEAVASVNTKTIVVLHTVGAVEMPWLNHPNIKAVIFALLPGQESGNAIADVLFGDVNPSGRLPFTVHKDRSDYAADILYESNGSPPQITYSEGLYFDYRHADKYDITPVFPFGHGLSYSEFKYTQPAAKRVNFADKTSDVSVSLTLSNVGKYDGHEVVQVYVAFPEAAGQPPKILKGFERVWVKRGASAKVEIILKKHDLRAWIDDGWQHVPGTYTFHIGASSRDIRLSADLVWG